MRHNQREWAPLWEQGKELSHFFRFIIFLSLVLWGNDSMAQSLGYCTTHSTRPTAWMEHSQNGVSAWAEARAPNHTALPCLSHREAKGSVAHSGASCVIRATLPISHSFFGLFWTPLFFRSRQHRWFCSFPLCECLYISLLYTVGPPACRQRGTTLVRLAWLRKWLLHTKWSQTLLTGEPFQPFTSVHVYKSNVADRNLNMVVFLVCIIAFTRKSAVVPKERRL